VNPDTEEAKDLRSWWETKGSSVQHMNLSDGPTNNTGGSGAIVKEGTLKELQEEAEKLKPEETLIFTSHVYVAHVKHKNKEGLQMPLFYDACTTCNKKVIDEYCPKCEVKSKSTPRFLISSMRVEDPSSEMWFSCFDDAAKVLLKSSATKIKSMHGSDDTGNELQKSCFAERFMIKSKAKYETYNGEQRLRHQIHSASKVDNVSSGKKMLTDILEMLQKNPEFKDLAKGYLPHIEQDQSCGHGCGEAWGQELNNLAIACA